MPVTQWAPNDFDDTYTAVGRTVETLPPGIYDVTSHPQLGLIWTKLRARTDLVLRFPESASTRVVEEIELFWTQRENFHRHDLPFKRGILLHGPPGSGKSSTLRLVAEAVVEDDGYVIQFTRPGVLAGAVRQLRAIHKDARVVVLMEDIDAILEDGNESDILNLLDGAEEVDTMVFLATTNYPERLKARISNRPSRFDRRVLIPHPSPEARQMYLETLLREGDDFDLERYVRDSQGMSLAHVKELFIATAILGADYTETLNELKKMGLRASAVEDEGFVPGGYS